MITNITFPLRAGAVSFKRWLGGSDCEPNGSGAGSTRPLVRFAPNQAIRVVAQPRDHCNDSKEKAHFAQLCVEPPNGARLSCGAPNVHKPTLWIAPSASGAG